MTYSFDKIYVGNLRYRPSASDHTLRTPDKEIRAVKSYSIHSDNYSGGMLALDGGKVVTWHTFEIPEDAESLILSVNLGFWFEGSTFYVELDE